MGRWKIRGDKDKNLMYFVEKIGGKDEEEDLVWEKLD